MALTVNTNIAAMNSLTNFQHTNRMLNQSFRRISSGLRITKAADDAAGLAVSENLDSQMMSLRQAQRNTEDGMGVIQTAEGAANEVANIIKRMRELYVEASSETLNSTERSYISTEVNALNSEIDRIGKITEFNGITLGIASAGSVSTAPNALDVQVGINNTSDDRITISFLHIRSKDGLSINTVPVAGASAGVYQNQLSVLDDALGRLNTYRTKYAATQNRLSSALNNLEVYTENLGAARSRIRDADFAHETAEMARFQIMATAGASILAQANQVNNGALRLLG
jgi:flagellin